MEKRIYIIFNPTADHGKAITHVSQIEAYLDRNKIPYKLELTRSSGDAITLAAEVSSRYLEEGRRGGSEVQAVVAAGGDGTVNEVINGMMQAKAAWTPSSGEVELPPFGVIPIGRGNDFAYGAKIPHTIEKACQMLHSESFYYMDVGRISGGLYPHGRFFGNGIGIGFDTMVGLEAAEVTWIPGFLGYVYGALKMLLVYPKAPLLRVTYGQNQEQVVMERSHQVSIMNGKRMGGTFYMAPEGDNSDKRLDLCMTKGELKRWQLLTAIGQYTKGSQAKNPHVYIDRAAEFTIEALEGELVCHADGETICTDGKNLKVECFPHALRILSEECE
jgi:diacylglycerol kinase (ATP)